MLETTPKNMISMSELQKISLKKLAKLSNNNSMLWLVDHKSKNHKAYVIIDYDSLQQKLGPNQSLPPKPTAIAKNIEFKKLGLFWDRPQMTDALFKSILSSSHHVDHTWAIIRLFERVPSELLIKHFSKEELAFWLGKVKLKKSLHLAWQHALNYWQQHEKNYS